MSFHTIILGLGAMGSAAAYHLARRGMRVLGLEQFDIPHVRGSSHGDTRMIRMCYHEHPDYVPLLRRAYELWRELEAASGANLLHVTGGLFIGREGGELVGGATLAARTHALPHEVLSRSALAARFPQFHVSDDHVALLEPAAGFVLAERAIAAQASLALRNGAELHAREPVLSWTADAAGVTVATDRGIYRAQRLVICAGAWAGRVIADLGVEIRATRQVLGWLWPKRPELFEPGRLPVWAVENEGGSLHYGFPITPDAWGLAPGFKLAHHFHGPPVDPDEPRLTPQPAEEDDIRGFVRRVLPDADGPTLALRTCMYECSPDSHFIIDHYPHHETVIVACGFSGHGFKFAPVVGEILADLATTGRTAQPIGFLGLDRLTRKKPQGTS
jgi:sarcosine oxidase